MVRVLWEWTSGAEPNPALRAKRAAVGRRNHSGRHRSVVERNREGLRAVRLMGRWVSDGIEILMNITRTVGRQIIGLDLIGSVTRNQSVFTKGPVTRIRPTCFREDFLDLKCNCLLI